jgi:tetratricopeptide (TPR) repeat protein
MKERPGHPFVLFNLGMTYVDAGRHDEAVDVLTRSLALADPSESQVRKAYALLIGSLTELGRDDEAWAACQCARTHFPHDPELAFRAGILAQRRMRLDEAEQCYLAALAKREPRHFTSIDHGVVGHKARHNLAAVYLERSKFDLAEEQWRIITSESPRFLHAWRGLAEALLRQGKHDELASLAEQSLQIPQRRALAILWQAWLFFVQGRREEATEKLLGLLSEFPNDPGPLHESCRILFDLGDLEAAEEGLQILVSRFPADAAAHHNLGTVYLRTQRFQEAEVESRISLRLRPAFAPSAVHLAFALENQGKVQDAVQAWQAVLAIEPRHKLAHYSLQCSAAKQSSTKA